VEKLVSSPAIQFKGSGWYITDYAKSGKSGADTTPASSSETASEKKTDKSDASKSTTDSSKPASSSNADPK
jgi:hypothetical protein